MTAIENKLFRYNPLFGEVPVEEAPGRVVWRCLDCDPGRFAEEVGAQVNEDLERVEGRG